MLDHSLSLQEEFWVLFWAMAGGVAVFIGLVAEEAADWMNERFLPQGYKPHKNLGNAGWLILMAGISIEIAVAGWSAHDAWVTKQMAKKAGQLEQQVLETKSELTNADPRNLPIVSILGRVRVEIRPPVTNFAANLHLRPIYSDSAMPLSDDEQIKKGQTALFQFGKHPGEDFNSEIPVVGWIGSMRYLEGISKTNDGNIRLDIYFDSSRSGSPVSNPNDITFNELQSVTFWLSNEWPPPGSVAGGHIDLLVNGIWPKSFSIPSQTNQNFPYRVLTTNLIRAEQR